LTKKEADGNKKTGLLQIEVREKGTNKAVYISTGKRLFQNQFSTTNGFSCKNHPNASLINNNVRALFNKIETHILSDNCKNLSGVKNYDKDKTKSDSFPNFMRRILTNKNPSYATMEHHNVLIRKVLEFGKLKTFKDESAVRDKRE